MAENIDLSALYGLNRDIIIDEEAFDRAATAFQELIDDIKALETNINDMLLQLSVGFNTPAGRKFMNAFRLYVIGPVVQQEIVIEQVCENLKIAKNGYQSVFDEYRQLLTDISD